MMGAEVLITGANRGIGLALAKVFVENGAHVFAACREPSAAMELHALTQMEGSFEILRFKCSIFCGLPFLWGERLPRGEQYHCSNVKAVRQSSVAE